MISANGDKMETVVPVADVAFGTPPPNALETPKAMGRPSPAPIGLVVKEGSSTLGKIWTGMLLPRSCTEIHT